MINDPARKYNIKHYKWSNESLNIGVTSLIERTDMDTVFESAFQIVGNHFDDIGKSRLIIIQNAFFVDQS